jgi:hypothetical protein
MIIVVQLLGAGMAVRYHFSHRPDLSPATSRIAARAYGKTLMFCATRKRIITTCANPAPRHSAIRVPTCSAPWDPAPGPRCSARAPHPPTGSPSKSGPELFSQLNELYGNASTVRSASHNDTGCRGLWRKASLSVRCDGRVPPTAGTPARQGWRRSRCRKVRRGGRAVMCPPPTLPDIWIRKMTGTSGPPGAQTFT